MKNYQSYKVIEGEFSLQTGKSKLQPSSETHPRPGSHAHPVKSRLCLFTDSLHPSGVGEHMLTLAGELSSRYSISFVCPPTTSGNAFLKRASELGLRTLALEARDDPAAIEALCSWLRAHRIDIFHCHAGIGWEGFGGINAAHRASTPAIVRTEHLPYLLTHPIQRSDHAQAVEIVDRVICVCEEAGATYLKEELPAHKLKIIYNGINARPVSADKRELLARLGLPEGSRIVLTVGRFSEQKNYSHLLSAVPTILEQVPGVHFIWVGEGELEDYIRGRVLETGLDGQVHILGRNTDVRELMAAADLFVLPSIFEGHPLVVLEAMSAGLPVVGTRVCGTAEAVADGITGRLIEPNDTEALIAAILEILSRPDLARSYGEAGLARVTLHFTARRMAAETACVYEEALQPVNLQAAQAGEYEFAQ